MSIYLASLRTWLDELLQPGNYPDYAPNGLQIEGRTEIERIVVGVSANDALIAEAIDRKADAIVVHHGFFWKSDPPEITGYRGRRIRTLIRNDISLFGYHLPLDAHPEYGNNAQIVRALGATRTTAFADSPPIGWLGEFEEARPREEVMDQLTAITQTPTAFLDGPEVIQRIAVVSGGAPRYFEDAVDAGADLFITGEASEQSQGIARELGANFAACGHHATERFGPRALGDAIAAHFEIDAEFVDVPNPV